MKVLKEELGQQPFSLCIDASNHNEKKLVPIVIRFFNGKIGLRTRILDMTALPGETADQLFEWICSALEKHQLNCANLISFCADNAPTNFGAPQQLQEGRSGNNVFTKLKTKRQNLIPVGCSAHLLHNAAKKGAEQLEFDIESIAFKLSSYFKGSTKRHTEFQEICDQYETDFVPLPTHAPTRWTTLSKLVAKMLEKWDPLRQLFSTPDKPRVLRDFFQSENSEPMCFFLQNVLKTFEEPIFALQKADLLIPDLITIMEQFRAKIDGRLKGIGNSGRPFFGGHFALRRAPQELETDFCNFYKIVLAYIDRWFHLQLLPKRISLINLQNKELNYSEVVELAEQLCPENAQADGLFDEISILNKALANISEEDFYCKTTEERWRSIFEVEGATETYKNLYRIVSAAISIPVSNAFIERIFSLANIQWTKERNLLEVDTVKALLLVTVNFGLTCGEMHRLLSGNKKLLEKIHSGEKYKPFEQE